MLPRLPSIPRPLRSRCPRYYENKMERVVTVRRDREIYQYLTKLTAGRPKYEPLFTRENNGKPILGYRGAWERALKRIDNLVASGNITIHDLRRSGIAGMHNKGIGATSAGMHPTDSASSRCVVLSSSEQQKNAAAIEGD